MTKTMLDLSRISSKLNKKTNQINEIFDALNQKLAALNLGLEVWLNNHLLEAGDYQIGYDDTGHETSRHRLVKLLGYSRVEGVWQIAVKDTVFETKYDPVISEEYEEAINPDPPRPILNASRDIRLKAIPLISTLLDKLKQKGETLLDEIEKTGQAASEL